MIVGVDNSWFPSHLLPICMTFTDNVLAVQGNLVATKDIFPCQINAIPFQSKQHMMTCVPEAGIEDRDK